MDPRRDVRSLEADDIPQVCDLFARTFRPNDAVRLDDLAACFRQTYLTSPLDAIRPASLVKLGAGGRIEGFIGAITVAAWLGGRRLEGGVLGNLMVDGPDRPRAALRLMRAMIGQDLDFIYSDTANRTSLDLARALKFRLLPLHCLEWIKVLRPCATGAFMLGRSRPRLGAMLTPMARTADLFAHRLAFAAVPRLEHAGMTDRPVAPQDFVAHAPAFIDRFALRPCWTEPELGWLVDQAMQKTGNGALHLREVLSGDGTRLGMYLLYVRAGAIAHTLQVVALRGREADVLEAVIRFAGTAGAAAVRGHASPMLADGLLRQSGIAYQHVSGTVAFARQPEVAQAFQSCDAFVGGLFGERWTRFVADKFV